MQRIEPIATEKPDLPCLQPQVFPHFRLSEEGVQALQSNPLLSVAIRHIRVHFVDLYGVLEAAMVAVAS
jgi:hypothetical protein